MVDVVNTLIPNITLKTLLNLKEKKTVIKENEVLILDDFYKDLNNF